MKVPLHYRLTVCLEIAFGLCCLAAPKVTAAQMLLNGSFEDPALTGTNSATGSGADWTASAGAYVVTNDYGFGTTPYGSQWVELANRATDTQTVSNGFTPGTAYVLSLVASDVSGFSGDQLTLSVSGAAAATQTFSLPTRAAGQNPGALQFANYALTFTPTTAGPLTVTLADGSNGAGVAIDDVQLAVPEPSTWALLAFGSIGMLGIALRRRHNA